MKKLYYEAHITIEPIYGDDLLLAARLAENNRFKIADLLMKKERDATELRSDKDTFLSAKDEDVDVLISMTRKMLRDLWDAGFKVWRYKIEKAIIDSQYGVYIVDIPQNME